MSGDPQETAVGQLTEVDFRKEPHGFEGLVCQTACAPIVAS